MNLRLFIFLTFVAVSMRIHAAEISATISTNQIHVGDRVVLNVSVTHKQGERPVIPSIAREPFITVWDEQSSDAGLDGGLRRRNVAFTLSSFVIGEHRIATNTVTLLKGDGTEEQLAFPELLINVVSVLSNPPPALAEIKPPFPAPGVDLRRIALMLAVILCVSLLGALLIRWWLTRPKAAPTLRTVPAHELALKALAALKSRGYMEEGKAELFYVELSAIVRLYLEQRFELHAPEQTTEEFIRSSSQSTALSQEHRQLTRDFLEQSDLVKFARFAPGQHDMQFALSAAERLVKETIPSVNGGPA